jgi:hypothetical protein
VVYVYPEAAMSHLILFLHFSPQVVPLCFLILPLADTIVDLATLKMAHSQLFAALAVSKTLPIAFATHFLAPSLPILPLLYIALLAQV